MSDDPHSFQTLRKYAETGPGVGETLYLNLAEDTLDDRHLVIIKSTSIDNALREALQAELRQDLKPGENRKLFGTDDAPLGRFSARAIPESW